MFHDRADSPFQSAAGAPDGAAVAESRVTHPPEGLSDDLSAQEVDAALRRALNELQRAEQSAVLCFAQIMRRKLYLDLGYSTIHQYASEALGFSMNRTCRFLRLAEDLERLPRLREAVATGEIGWTKAREVVRVASPRTEEQWLAAAKQKGRRELEGLVARARKLKASERRSNPGQGTLEVVTAGSVPADAEKDTAAAELAPADVQWVDDAPAAVVFRLAPLQLARYEALMESIRRARVVPTATSREEILLEALGQLLASCEEGRGGSDPATVERHGTHREASHRKAGRVASDRETEAVEGREAGAGEVPRGEEAPASAQAPVPAPGGRAGEGTLPRGKVVSPYRIIIYTCDACRRAVVQTSRGEKAIGPVELAAIHCDAVVKRPGARNRATIAPSVRAAVLRRDRHRCRASGCGETRFLEVHHVVEREAGGSNHPENLVTLCSRCHHLWHERGLGAMALRLEHAQTG
jgi:hypothetical protein